jgi:hypothetical protein
VLRIGTTGNEGDISVRDASDREVFQFDAQNAVLRIGTTGNEGDLIVRDASNREVFHFDAGSAVLRIGTTGNEGDLIVRDASNREVFHFDAGSAVLRIGTTGNEGDLIVRDSANREVFHFNSESAVLRIGTTGNEGDISVRDSSNREVFQFDANFAVLRVGAAGNEGDIIVRDSAGSEVIHLNGDTGDIILNNADAAEHFEIAESVEVTPGMLMVLNPTGKLEPSSIPYDRKVVGVVAGAGKYRPGIILGHKGDAAGQVPISVLGKVSCQADATYAPIEVGDLLTTSSLAGYAMKADDPQKAFGSVIGKALSPLGEGTGLVDVLITLQ